MLDDLDPRVRVGAVYAFFEMGPLAKAAVPRLIRALNDSDPRVCRSAIDALGEIGPEAQDALPALMQTPKDGSLAWSHTRHALRSIGPAAVPALVRAENEGDPRVRPLVALVLEHILDDQEQEPSE